MLRKNHKLSVDKTYQPLLTLSTRNVLEHVLNLLLVHSYINDTLKIDEFTQWPILKRGSPF